MFRSLQLNEKIISPITTGDNIGHRNRDTVSYITAGCAYRFRQMYYNPRAKEISFYVSPKDSAFIYNAEGEKTLFDMLKNKPIQQE